MKRVNTMLTTICSRSISRRFCPLITNCAATRMQYTIKVRLAKSHPVPWLTVYGTDTMADAPSPALVFRVMPSASMTIPTR